MSTLRELIAAGEVALTEGSVFELLRRDPRIEFDAHIAHAGLIYDDVARERLAAVHRAYMKIARDAALPIFAFADTWRASRERIAASPFAGRSVNRDNIDFLRAIVAPSGARAFLGALTGPRGDAYRPGEAPGPDEAMRYHEFQIAELESAGVDLIVTATLPALGEARGIAALLAQTTTPWMLSFVVRPSGVLLDGTPLGDAIATIDDSLAAPPVGYSVNCVHPDIARRALATLPDSARRRVVLFQGNASARTPEELDNLPDVDADDPESFAASVLALTRESSVRIVGGCCGTDERHMRAVARRVPDRCREGV